MQDSPLAYADEAADYCASCRPPDPEVYAVYRGERDAPIVCAVCHAVLLP